MALLLLGFQRFLYKVAAEKNCNTALTSFSFMGTVALVSSCLFVARHETVTNLYFLLFIALVNSISFLSSTMTTMEALKRISATVAYPIIRLNTAIVVIFSIIYFEDRLSLSQVLGILLAMVVIVVLVRSEHGEHRVVNENVRLGFILILIAVISGAVATVSTKFAAMYTSKLGFMAVSYIFSTGFSLGLRKKLETERANPDHRNALLIGLCMGLANFAGFYAFLKAVAIGPLSIIISIVGMYFVIAIVLSAMLYREKLSPRKIGGIFLTVVAITLMKM